MGNMLVIVDMVNGFINFGALADKNINKITPNIINLIKFAKNKDYKIVAFKDSHSKDDKEFEVFPAHCLKGTPESELIPELKRYEGQFDYVIEKNTTNGFITKEFYNLIKTNKFDNVVVCGCCTDICVLNFVESYLKYIKKFGVNTKIYVVENACYTFDGKNHDAQEYHNSSLSEMKNLGARIIRYFGNEKQNIK